jgi:hypothetical protein
MHVIVQRSEKCNIIFCTLILVIALLLSDQRLRDLKFAHGSRVSFCRESMLTRENMSQIHAT